MNPLKKPYLHLLALLGILMLEPTQAQETQVLGLRQFLSNIALYHPVAKQAQLAEMQGEAFLLEQKGNLDPYLYGNFNNKFFEQTHYYNQLNAGLVVPTYIGIDVKAYYEAAGGTYLNQEDYLPSGGLLNIGVEIPVLQGLLMDQRRADIQSSKVFSEVAKVQRVKMLNDLYLGALSAYVNWTVAYERLNLMRRAIELAEIRFNAVKESFIQGKNPAIDTLEAYIQYQNRVIGFFDTELLFIKRSLELSNFLWLENEIPAVISPGTIPMNLEDLGRELPEMAWKESDLLLMIDAHPEIMMAMYKVQMADIDRRLKVEKLKPKLNLQYNFLNSYSDFGMNSDWWGAYSFNNYKMGIQFEMPIFLREGRGSLQGAKFKLEQSGYELDQKSLSIRNKALQHFAETQILAEQVLRYNQVATNSFALLQGENNRFSAGTSSLFLVNARELSWMDSQIKSLETEGKYREANFTLWHSVGVLHLLVSQTINQP
jgi:outer membrane protein TolC